MQQMESKDKRLKYVEMPKIFNQKANDINITSRQHLRICEKLAIHVSTKKTYTPKDFEENEFLKDFLVKSATLNEKIINLIEWMAEFLTETAIDSTILIEGAKIRGQILDQSDAILLSLGARDKLVKDLYDLKKMSFENVK